MSFADFRSDTITRPTPAMLDAMMQANVGDDVFGEDPTINALEEKLSAYFGMEAGLFCASGTMANQIAISVHVKPGDEVICDELAHIYLYEGGGIARNAGASVKLLKGDHGRFSLQQVKAAVNNPHDVHASRTRLVSLEDTCNKGGGSCWEVEAIAAISAFCRSHGFGIHLDGARLFNALVARNHDPVAYASHFDSISICLSKGLGAPVGSVLLGRKDFILEARRVRKVFGGGMRQAGYLAAACIYALDNHVSRLEVDHLRALRIAAALETSKLIALVLPVETNIVIGELHPGKTAYELVEDLAAAHIKAFPFGADKIRFVTHLDNSENDIERVEAHFAKK